MSKFIPKLGAKRPEKNVSINEKNVEVSEKNAKVTGSKDNDEQPNYFGLTGTALIRAITVASCFGFLLFGYDQGVMSGLLTGRQFQATFPATDARVQGDYRASLLQATYTAIYELGCLAGAVFAFFFGERLGRRKMMQSGAVIVIIGTVIQVTAFSGHHAGLQFLIGRVITGVGVGKETATIPSWQAETSRAHNRGLLICIEASMVAIGTAIAYWIDFGSSYVESSFAWRFPISLQAIFAIALLLALTRLPESPRWCAANNRDEEAHRIVAALAGKSTQHPETLSQIRLLRDNLERERKMASNGLGDVFKGGPGQYRRRAVIGMSTQFFQQIGGCNAVIYFAPIIFQQNLGLDRTLSLILGGAVVTCYAISALGSYFMIETLGRRKMFIGGSIVQAVSMFIIAGCLIPGNDQAAKGAVFGLFLYLVAFGASWLELPWLYPAELNPMRTRTTANALSTITNWLWNFTVVEFVPPMLSSIGWGTFLFFAIINLLFIPVIYLFYPETKGQTLEGMDTIFAKAYYNNESYVKVAHEMANYSPEKMEAEAAKLRTDNDTQVEHGTNSSHSTLVEGSTP